MSDLRCAVLTMRRHGDHYASEPCGAPARILVVNGDHLFPTCHRHDGRLERAFGTPIRPAPHARTCPFRGDQRLAVSA